MGGRAGRVVLPNRPRHKGAVALCSHAFIVGYANCYQGYFPTPIAYEEGGYEVNVGRWSRFTAAAGESVQETTLELLHNVR